MAGLILLVLGWVYLLTTSVQTALGYVLNNTGILNAAFYCVTAIAAVVYYRRRVLGNWADLVTIGIMPIASVAFLGYVAVTSILSAPAAQSYSLLGFVVVGFILILVARFGWKSEFFAIRRESWSPEDA